MGGQIIELQSNVEIDPKQTELTDEQNEALAAEAIEEAEAAERGEVIRYDKESEEDEEEKKPDDEESEPSEDEEEEEKKPDAEEESEPSEEEEEQEEEESEGEEEKKPEESVRDYALKHNITEDEAKKEIEANQSVIEKYKTPEEMARALRSTQSAYDKLRNENGEDNKERKHPYANVQDPSRDIGKYVNENREKLLNDYKAKFPNKFESLTEEAVLEEVAEKMLANYNNWVQGELNKRKELASDKRDELLNGLSESDAQFLPDIKAVLSKTDDSIVLSKNYNITDVVRWAKGGKYDDDVKKAYEEGLKAGKEKAEIMGETPKVPAGGGKKPRKLSSKSVSLNQQQKDRAVEMFDHLSGSDEDKYNLYRETYAKELKENPDFLG
jgi:hypothetical protein